MAFPRPKPWWRIVLNIFGGVLLMMILTSGVVTPLLEYQTLFSKTDYEDSLALLIFTLIVLLSFEKVLTDEEEDEYMMEAMTKEKKTLQQEEKENRHREKELQHDYYNVLAEKSLWDQRKRDAVNSYSTAATAYRLTPTHDRRERMERLGEKKSEVENHWLELANRLNKTENELSRLTYRAKDIHRRLAEIKHDQELIAKRMVKRKTGQNLG